MDNIAKAKDRIEFEAVQLCKATKEHVINHTRISEDLYDLKYRVEWYFLSPEAKDLGVVDYIISEDCTLDDIC